MNSPLDRGIEEKHKSETVKGQTLCNVLDLGLEGQRKFTQIIQQRCDMYENKISKICLLVCININKQNV